MTKKQEIKRLSVKSLYALLLQVRQNKIDLPKLVLACETQESLALYNNPKKKISEMSLRTHMTYSDKCIEGGYSKLDELRAIIADKPRTKAQSKGAGRSIKVNPLHQCHQVRLALLAAYNDLKDLALPLITDDPAIYDDYLRHNEQFREIVGMRLVVDSNDKTVI